MFSQAQKQQIAAEVEKLLLSFNHPEMPKKRPSFQLHIDGAEAWAWADIEPNWKFDNRPPGVNPFNEMNTQEKYDPKNDPDIRAID